MSLISDAGTPLLSDPGRGLINNCILNKIKIVPIPGPSSIAAAVSVSGFKDQFLFYGFLPKTENELNKVLSSLEKNTFTQVFFVPSLKINFYLKKFKKYFSGRKILIAKEITKLHEDFVREELDKIKMFKSQVKGELTIVISEKKTKDRSLNKEEIIKMARKYLKKYSLKDSVNLIYEKEKQKKKEIYKLCLKLKNEINN